MLPPGKKVEAGGAHYVTWISPKKMKLNTKLGKKHFQFPVPLVITSFYIFEVKSVQFQHNLLSLIANCKEGMKFTGTELK